MRLNNRNIMKDFSIQYTYMYNYHYRPLYHAVVSKYYIVKYRYCYVIVICKFSPDLCC